MNGKIRTAEANKGCAKESVEIRIQVTDEL